MIGRSSVCGWLARWARTALVLLVGAGIGLVAARRPPAALAQATHGKPADSADVKAPVTEVLHCPLAFAGVHLLKEFPETSRVAYHYCKPLNAKVNQCILYDGTGPDARLIGIEYLVTDDIYQAMPADEKPYWHDHKYEVDAGLIRSITQTGAEEKATLGVVRTLWGKVFHTWTSGVTYPSGPARLFWSVTGEEPFTLSAEARLPAELRTQAGSQTR
jgi:hypothetical protein